MPGATSHGSFINWKDVECSVCIAALTLLEEVIETNPSEKEIEDAIMKICVLVQGPDLDHAVCSGAIVSFAPTLIPILLHAGLDPQKRCVQLRACSPGPVVPTSPQKSPPSTTVSSVSYRPGTSPPAPVAIRIAHVSDMHWDPKYSVGSATNCVEPLCCRQGVNGTGSAAYWGDYNCDLTGAYFQSALSFINSLNVDLVLWTGDSTPHDVWNESISSQLSDLGNVANSIYSQVKSPSYLAMGNHDTWPVDQFSTHYEDAAHHDDFVWLRQFFAANWTRYLPAAARVTLVDHGYYTLLVKPSLRIVALNTQWGDNLNFYLYLNEDPEADELGWLYTSARANDEKVILMGHISPGKAAVSSLSAWAQRYLSLFVEFRDVIILQLFGHTHNDEFEIVFDSSNVPVGVNLLAPSLTTFAGMGHNPSVRVFELSSDYQVLDYVQYYSNLSRTLETNAPRWEVLYRATQYYGIPDISAQSWYSVVRSMLTPGSDTFSKWYFARTAGAPQSPCTTTACQEAFICYLLSANPDQAALCPA